jgi:hypothetical protein
MPIHGAYAQYVCLPPLSQARQAQELLAEGGVVGKIVLMCDASEPAAPATARP